MRAYLDNLTNENKALQVRVGELETALNDALTAKNAIQHNRLVLEDLLHKTKEKVRAALSIAFVKVEGSLYAIWRAVRGGPADQGGGAQGDGGLLPEPAARQEHRDQQPAGRGGQCPQVQQGRGHGDQGEHRPTLTFPYRARSDPLLLLLLLGQVRIEESVKEMEAHKAKRLAARNEMINLAKVTLRLFDGIVALT